MSAQDKKDKEEEDEIAREMAAEDADFEFNEDDMRDEAADDETAEEAARRGVRQVKYELRPAKKYVTYIAKANATRTWMKSETNIGCLEVQIARVTENVRQLAMHCREFNNDRKMKRRLIVRVALRRRLLDKLAWKDLESYINIRDKLQIRHSYRMEALIGRLPAYKYAQTNRKHAPGRKAIMRLKKSKKLLSKRLATQLRQGKPAKVIHKTQKRLLLRKSYSAAYDESKWLTKGKPVQEYVDPLNQP